MAQEEKKLLELFRMLSPADKARALAWIKKQASAPTQIFRSTK